MDAFSVFNINDRHFELDGMSYVKIGKRIFIPKHIYDYALTTEPNGKRTNKSYDTQNIKIPQI